MAPLDWGLGHATRCAPLINNLSRNNKVIIGVTERNRFFFNKLFPHLILTELPSHNISYSRSVPAWLKVLMQWPSILKVMSADRKMLDRIISTYGVNVVISDCRYGLITKKAKCILLTHQLNLQVHLFHKMVNAYNRRYINAFDEVWVPDYQSPEKRLSGDLSSSGKISVPVKYLGPQSLLGNNPSLEKTCDVLILLSGEEPQRSMLEDILLEKVKNSSLKIVLVRGVTRKGREKVQGVTIIDFADTIALEKLVNDAKTIICRSGYSTLMDLDAAGSKNMLLIPTPGQPEQEYLAEYWAVKFGAITIKQDLLRKSHIPLPGL